MQDNNNRQITTNLLGVFDTIEVNATDQISQDDKEFCELLQSQCYEVLDNLQMWYDRFYAEVMKTRTDGEISVLRNGRLSINRNKHISQTATTPFSQYLFNPIRLIDAIVEDYFTVYSFFAYRIIDHFSSKYRLTIHRPTFDREMQPFGIRQKYTYYINYIMRQLNGKSLREKAEEEIITRATDTVKRGDCIPVVKGNILSFFSIYTLDVYWLGRGVCYIAYDSISHIQNICAAVALYATRSIRDGIDFIPGFNPNNVKMGIWYDISNDTIQQARFYKNGRIDFRFGAPDAAKACFQYLRLYSIIR